ncbi:TIGR00303 family protein [Archaeoglobales archaeon]|nr:MAG: TIGR00303 family protein [Archaeoglobales archaeon]
MYEVVKGDAERHLKLLKKKVAFVFVIGNTKTAEVEGITVAGENPELIKYTPPADVELLYYGKCKSISAIPATPDGKPTPALITYTALKLVDVPFFVVDSGLMVKPKIPYISIEAPVGNNIAESKAMDYKDVLEAFERAKTFGEQISKYVDIVIIGESIPAGTTTAAAVLKALGLNAAVSSSMPKNPVELKMKVVEKALGRMGKISDPFEIISEVGDPVMVGVSGIAMGSRKPVVLAGGTQMVAIANVLKRLGDIDAVIATTSYVTNDKNADMNLSPCPVISVDLGLDKSEKEGLRAYAQGFVKEGVGAGGAALLACVNGINQDEFVKAIEGNYYKIVESKMV